jgi:hypothetical protein
MNKELLILYLENISSKAKIISLQLKNDTYYDRDVKDGIFELEIAVKNVRTAYESN